MKNNIEKGALGFPSILKAVIFDLDGTLMNTLDDIAKIANSVLKEFSYSEVEVERYKYFLGNGASALLDSLHKEVNMKEEDRETFDSIYMERYGNSQIGVDAIYPEINELLQELKARKIKLGVLTNKPSSIALPLMDRIFPNVFDMVFGQKDEYPRKPDPFGLEFLSYELEYSREEILYLGDTNTDMLTGKNYGAYTVGVLWGFRDRKELEEAGADLIIERPLELLKYIR